MFPILLIYGLESVFTGGGVTFVTTLLEVVVSINNFDSSCFGKSSIVLKVMSYCLK
jgi:hypothetical protein